MLKEDERYEKKDENNLCNSSIIEINNDIGKKEQNIGDNKINKISKKKDISKCDEHKIDKSHHSKKISLNDINRISNSIAKIIVPTNEGKNIGTCFFMFIMNKKFIITNEHIIPKKISNTINLVNNAGNEFPIILGKQRMIKKI